MSLDSNPLDNIEKEVENHQNQIDMQLEMTKRIAQLIPEYGGDVKESRLIEFFFYADNEKDAKALAEQLKINYKGKNIEVYPFRNQFSITGQTDKKYIKSQDFAKWITQMNELAFSLDCEFDGWGSPV